MSQALHEYALKNYYGAPDWHEPLFSVFFGDLTEAQTAALKLELQLTRGIFAGTRAAVAIPTSNHFKRPT